ncbi:hypothetical protein LSAT2_016296, partial [Lamellibrachia satsuma]
ELPTPVAMSTTGVSYPMTTTGVNDPMSTTGVNDTMTTTGVSDPMTTPDGNSCNSGLKGANQLSVSLLALGGLLVTAVLTVVY